MLYVCLWGRPFVVPLFFFVSQVTRQMKVFVFVLCKDVSVVIRV